MNKLKKLFFIFLFITTLEGKDIEAKYSFTLSSGVTDMIRDKEKLYISTLEGTLFSFDMYSKEIKALVKMPKTKDFLGEKMPSKIYSIDILEDKILLLAQGFKGARQLLIYENQQLRTVLSDQKHLFISQAKFINKNLIIFASLANEIYLYNIASKKTLYIKQISASKFSHFVLNEKKDEIIIADESGDLKVHNSFTGSFIKIYEKQNLDNVFQVDIKNNVILTAGQDRRAVVYNQGKTFYKKVNFLIYACALSPSGKLAAIAHDEENNVLIFDTKTKKELFELKGNKMLLNHILFINEKEIFISNDGKTINYYILP